MSVLIIAEAGVNHNGSIDMACRLVDAAADAGADLVKFQTFRADRLVTRDARKADYQVQVGRAGESQHAMLQRLELTHEDHLTLIQRCALRGIGFFSTGFDIPSVQMLAQLGLSLFKVPSGELSNLPYLQYIGSLGWPVIVSTGMATLSDVEAALLVLEAAGTPRERITVLHCTTEYPAPFSEVNLRAMLTMGAVFGVPVGYSDHTTGIEVSVAAVALGATVIEKHFTLDRTLPGPDHLASLEPQELAAMVSAIRNVEVALGDGVKRVGRAEGRNKSVARKSIVAARAIRTGEQFSSENLAVKRPGTGVSPMRWDEVVGRTASRDFDVDELIEL